MKDLRDQARALEVYAHQAQNRDAEARTAQIRIRAEVRCGELIREQQSAGELAPNRNGLCGASARRFTYEPRGVRILVWENKNEDAGDFLVVGTTLMMDYPSLRSKLLAAALFGGAMVCSMPSLAILIS